MTRSEQTESLLELLRRNYKTDGLEDLPLWDDEPPSGETLPDGYIRRSPVQTYRDGPAAGSRRPPVVLILLALILALILLGIILWRTILH